MGSTAVFVRKIAAASSSANATCNEVDSRLRAAFDFMFADPKKQMPNVEFKTAAVKKADLKFNRQLCLIEQLIFG